MHNYNNYCLNFRPREWAKCVCVLGKIVPGDTTEGPQMGPSGNVRTGSLSVHEANVSSHSNIIL